MSTTTAATIIGRAARLAGVLGIGQALAGDYLSEWLRELRLLCSTLRLGPDFAYTKTTTVQAIGAVEWVTIGPGATLDIARPYRIERESFTRSGGIDRELVPIDRAAYNAISQKDTATSWPQVVFFDRASPTGRLYFWPVAACELHLVTLQSPAAFDTATAETDLPDGYEDTIGLLLAERIAVLAEVDLRPEVARQVRTAKRMLDRSNVDVPQLDVGPKYIDPETAFIGG